MRLPSFHRLLFVLLLLQGIATAEDQKPADDEKKPGFFGRVTRGVTRGVTGLFNGKDKEPDKDKDKPAEKEKTQEAPPKKKKAEEPEKPAPKKKKSEEPEKPAPKKKPAESPPEKNSAEKAGPEKSKPAPTVSITSKSKGSKSKPAEPKKEDKPAPAKKEEPAKEEFVLVGPVQPFPPTNENFDAPAAAKTASADAKDAKPAEEKKTAMRPDGSGEFDDLAAAFSTDKKPVPADVKAAEQAMSKMLAEPLPPPPPLPSSDGSWEVVKLDHDYVTAESIQRFYRFSTLKKDGSTVWFRSPTIIMKAVIGSQDLMINNIKFVLSYPIAESKGKALISRLDLCKLLDPVLMPNHISKSEMFDTVVIDAGHGGHDSGARGVYGYEKDFTLQMAFAVRDALQKKGFKTVLTRSTDEFITLGGRVAIANATPRSIFISLHFNSSGPSASGIETWALSPQGTSSTFMGQRGTDNMSFTGNQRDSENIALATAVHGMIIHKFKLVDRGIKRARWSVLTGCTRPGILFEGGFVTNGTDCRLIAAPTFRTAIADCISEAVVNYRRALQPRVVQPTVK